MKIIFLDIDGVVCTHRSLCLSLARWYDIPIDADLYWDDIVVDPRLEKMHRDHLENNKPAPSLYSDDWPFDHVAVDLIHRIVRKHPDVKFVISSTWRKDDNIASLTEKFNLKGMTLPIFAYTEVREDENRALEIQTWLDFNKDIYGVTHFCAIDDNPMVLKKAFPDNFVQTFFGDGFTENEYKDVMKILEIE